MELEHTAHNVLKKNTPHVIWSLRCLASGKEIQYLYTLGIEILYRYTTSHGFQNLNAFSTVPQCSTECRTPTLTSYTS